MLSIAPGVRTPSTEEIRRHMPLVRKVVTKIFRRLPSCVVLDDLLAAGVQGLLAALQRNGGDDGETFERYARIRIRGAVIDELRRQDWVPRKVRDDEASAVSVVRIEDLGTPDRPREFADESGLDADDRISSCEDAQALASAIAQLPERERMIIQMYYFEGVLLKDIGTMLSISDPRVSQVHGRAVARLRTLLAAPS